MKQSLYNAKKNIVIFISDAKISRIQKRYPFFITLLSRGLKIYICTHKNYDDVTKDYLEGIWSRILHTDTSINAIMIDEEIVWNGSSSYLGVQNHDLYYIKTKDESIVEELISKIS